MMTFNEYLNERDLSSHPDGTYIAAQLSDDSKKQLYDWVKQNNISKPTDPSEYHATVLYSRKGVPEVEHNGYDFNLPVNAKVSGWKIFDTKLGSTGKCLVAAIHSPELAAHHENIRKQFGATHDFPSYQPHVTISYDHPGDTPPENVPDMNLKFDKMEIKPLNLDFKPKTA